MGSPLEYTDGLFYRKNKTQPLPKANRQWQKVLDDRREDFYQLKEDFLLVFHSFSGKVSNPKFNSVVQHYFFNIEHSKPIDDTLTRLPGRKRSIVSFCELSESLQNSILKKKLSFKVQIRKKSISISGQFEGTTTKKLERSCIW